MRCATLVPHPPFLGLSYYNKNRERIAKKYNKELKDNKKVKQGKFSQNWAKNSFIQYILLMKKFKNIWGMFLKIFLKKSYGWRSVVISLLIANNGMVAAGME